MEQGASTLVDVTQLKEILTSYMQEAVAELRKEFAAVNQFTQPDIIKNQPNQDDVPPDYGHQLQVVWTQALLDRTC